MKVNFRNLKTGAFAATLTIFCLLAINISAQNKAETKEKYREFCSNNNWSSDDHVSFNEVREMTLPATGSLSVDGGQNGGVRRMRDNCNHRRVWDWYTHAGPCAQAREPVS